MNHSNWLKTSRLLLVMAVLLLILLAISLVQHTVASRVNMSPPLPMGSMQMAKAANPPADAAAAGAPSGTQWHQIRELFPRFDGYIPPGRYWLRLPLELSYRSGQAETSLYIYHVRSIRLFADGEELAPSAIPTHSAPINPYYIWYLVPLSGSMKTSELVLYLDTEGMNLPLPVIRTTGAEALYPWLFQQEFSNYMLSALFVFCGTAALFFWYRRRERAYLYFALFAFAIGYAAFVRNQTFMLISTNTWFTYLHDLVLPLAVFAFVGFLAHLYPGLYPKAHRRLKAVLLVFCLACTTAALTSAYVYDLLLLRFFPPLCLVTLAFVARTIFRAFRSYGDKEQIGMTAGFAVVALQALLHLCSVAFIPLYWQLQQWLPLLRYWNNTLVFWSIFLLLICFIRVMYARYDKLNEDLAAFNHNLEAIVQERTGQLEAASQQLEVTMRDSAEAMVSALVLEERQRMAYTIHDTLGHTLTATIVQMEAAKRLLEKDAELARLKFNAAQQLVRKGLEEIRGSLQLLQEDPSYYDLLQSMEKLMSETSAAYGVSIEHRFDPLPEQLTILQKRVLYHALQEGLANGIRHGRCDRFDLVLTRSEDSVTFSLVNNGLPYTAAQLGPGLKVMEDRVLQLGGTLRIASAEQGCVLSLVLPIRHGA
ncbi:signal transduction histidine kinase [Paenibacillus phyllosphaerae]|uniref:histidine kinase n=1 Tax=Paenibacillus phyllosphaerae TaxID=274593 RepID=A0A7W5FKU3_9BACL|nr:histidine kinase [Paenibacillus phyllosphaerae]MBB3108418.1 signal transduction histidine kinase [Paenibacillus phyllosphaerae]